MHGVKRSSIGHIAQVIIGLLCIFSSQWLFAGTTSAKVHSKARKSTQVELVGIFTVYTPRIRGRSRKRHITADETELKGLSSCIVANNSLKLGTKIVIEGIGACEVHDRIGKGVRANRFDIFMNADPKSAKEFGKRRLKYTIERG